MTDLATLSLIRANLPTFPGNTVADQLLNGRTQAQLILMKYVPNFAFNADEASSTLRRVSAWEERNQDQLNSILSDPNVEALPQALQVSFGSDEAQAYILAVFTQAAIGMGPWASGAVDRAVNAAAPGDEVSLRWAQEDALTRLNVFASIVKLEQDGFLAKVFVPPGATSGFGLALGIAPVVVWAIVATVVALASVLLIYLYSSQQLDKNNRLMSDLCKKAQEQGDQATVQQCIKQSANLQNSPLDTLTSGFTKVALVLGGAYLAFTLLPPLISSWRKGKGK